MGDLESSERKIQVRFCYRREGEQLRETGGDSSGVKFLSAKGWGWTQQMLSFHRLFLNPGKWPVTPLGFLKESQSKTEKTPPKYPEEGSGRAGWPLAYYPPVNVVLCKHSCGQPSHGHSQLYSHSWCVSLHDQRRHQQDCLCKYLYTDWFSFKSSVRECGCIHVSAGA